MVFAGSFECESCISFRLLTPCLTAHSRKRALNDANVQNERQVLSPWGPEFWGNYQILGCKQQARKCDGKWLTINDIFISFWRDGWGKKWKMLVPWLDVSDAVNIKHSTEEACCRFRSWLLFSFTGCKSQLMFHFICVSELLGSAKKVNVNFQDTDGWVALLYSLRHIPLIHFHDCFSLPSLAPFPPF